MKGPYLYCALSLATLSKNNVLPGWAALFLFVVFIISGIMSVFQFIDWIMKKMNPPIKPAQRKQATGGLRDKKISDKATGIIWPGWVTSSALTARYGVSAKWATRGLVASQYNKNVSAPENVAMNLRSSINLPRKLGILAALLLSFKQPSLAVEPSAANNKAASPFETNAGEKSYEQAAAEGKAYEQGEIDRLSKRVAELNTKADQEGRRRAELEEVVNKGLPGAGQAIGELQILRKGIAMKERNDYILQLKAKRVEILKKLAATEEKLKKVSSSRGSWFSNERELDAEELKLAGWRASLGSAERINNILLQRLESGATTFSNGPMTNEEFQESFFPTR